MIMLDTLKEKGKTIGHEIGHAWDVVAEGWRELSHRSSSALTRFVHAKDTAPPTGSALTPYPRWSLLAGEVEETAREIIVRLEVPGMEKDDCHVKIDGNRLFLSGEKHFERTSERSAYHVMERAYGSFQRVIPLPKSVVEEKAEATYQNGVLTVRLPKRVPERSRSIPVS
jgi:HSP20 family protein